MKTKLFLIAAPFLFMAVQACTNSNARYVDLETGEPVALEKDEESGLMVHAESRKPVKIYVDTETNDTIYGKTGKVINGNVKKNNDGRYVYLGSDYKMEREKDGDYTVKYGDDAKVKYDDGELKIKRGDYKKEVEKDGDITIKTKNKKIKIDGETGERKVKYD